MLLQPTSKDIILHLKCHCFSNSLQPEKVIELREYLKLLDKRQPDSNNCKWTDKCINKGEYCINCSKWICNQCQLSHDNNKEVNNNYYCNHMFIEREVYFNCREHKKESYTYHCYNCKTDICNKCLVEQAHFYHDKERLYAPSIIYHNQEIHNSIQRNKEQILSLVEHYKSDIGKSSTINQEDLKNAIETYEEHNNQLFKLMKIINNTARIAKDNPSFYLLKLLQNIKIDLSLKHFNPNSNENDYANMITKYIYDNHILKIDNIKLSYLRSHYLKNSLICENKEIIQTDDNHYISIINEKYVGDSINKWRIDSNSRIQTMKSITFQSLINYFIQVNNNYFLIAVESEHQMRVYDSNSLVLMTTIEISMVVEKMILLDNNILCIVSSLEITLMNAITMKIMRTKSMNSPKINHLAKLSDNRIAYCCENSKSVNILSYDLTCIGELAKTSLNHINVMLQLDDKRIITGGNCGEMILWNDKTYNNDEVNCFKSQHIYPVNTIIQLSNGRLVSGSSDSIVKVWCIETYQCLYNLVGFYGEIILLKELKDNTILIQLKDENDSKNIKNISDIWYIKFAYDDSFERPPLIQIKDI